MRSLCVCLFSLKSVKAEQLCMNFGMNVDYTLDYKFITYATFYPGTM